MTENGIASNSALSLILQRQIKLSNNYIVRTFFQKDKYQIK